MFVDKGVRQAYMFNLNYIRKQRFPSTPIKLYVYKHEYAYDQNSFLGYA